MKLLKFQSEGLEDLIKAFKKRDKVCLAWYTGAGKTNLFLELCRHLIKENPQVKIGVSSYFHKVIKEQVYDRTIVMGLEHLTEKIMCGKKINLDKNIFVFNPQAIHLNKPNIKFDYLIIDEGHVGLAEGTIMLRGIITELCTETTKHLLVSATPWDTLALDEFKDTLVLKRPLDQGLRDGLITDFKFHAEEALITFKESDFTRAGDLGKSAQTRNMAILKSSCLGKFEYILKNYNKEIGKKCLVILPPGNFAEVARTFAERYNDGLVYVQKFNVDRNHRIDHLQGEEVIDSSDNCDIFKSVEGIRFLFVVNKCSVGFDMQELDSVIDLTMTRNITTLAQRCGRIARKNGEKKKHYFYVYDQSLMKDRLEWLISTMIDFSLGGYDGWTTKSSKYKKQIHGQWFYNQPYSVTLKEVVRSLRDDNLIGNRKSLAYVDYDPPTAWTLTKAKEEAKKYISRTDMWANKPGLYKWFRLYAKKEMDSIFPLKYFGKNKWNEQTVTEALNNSKNRREFNIKYSGAADWIYRNNREDLKEKHLPVKYTTNEEIIEAAKSFNTMQEFRRLANNKRLLAQGRGIMPVIRSIFVEKKGYKKQEEAVKRIEKDLEKPNNLKQNQIKTIRKHVKKEVYDRESNAARNKRLLAMSREHLGKKYESK